MYAVGGLYHHDGTGWALATSGETSEIFANFLDVHGSGQNVVGGGGMILRGTA